MSEYKIFRFTAEKVNGLKVVQITPEGKSVQITGKVGSGKTSVIETLIQTLTGGITLAEGEDYGKSEVDLKAGNETFRIKRSVSKDGRPYLEVLTGESLNLRVSSPSEFLKTLVGPDIAISPTMFSGVRGGGKERKRILFDALGIDTTAQDEEIEGLNLGRQMLNKEKQALQVSLDQNPVDPNLPEKEVSATDLVNALDEARQHNASLESLKERLGRQNAEYDEDLHDQERALEEIRALEEKLIQMKDLHEKKGGQLREQGNLLSMKMREVQTAKRIDTDELEEKVATVEETNREIRAKLIQAEKEKILLEKKDEYFRLGKAIQEIEARKQLQVDRAMPIPGLSIGEDDVYWKKNEGAPVPGARWSTGESILLGCAIRAAQGDRSPLKVVFVDDVSLLDVETLEKMRKVLGSYQVFEVHNTLIGEPVNVITIEEGEVKQDE